MSESPHACRLCGHPTLRVHYDDCALFTPRERELIKKTADPWITFVSRGPKK